SIRRTFLPLGALYEGVLCQRAAAAIADGKVVGWFQGQIEWGPRALGNRSILCDPRRTDIKALNTKIKRRESFRPFAPWVLEEAVSEWFEEDNAVPFMMQVFQIRVGETRAHPCSHPLRRFRATADGMSPHESTVPQIDQGLSRSHGCADGVLNTP